MVTHVGTHEVLFYHEGTHEGTHMVSEERIEHAIATHPDPVVTVGDVIDVLEDDPSDTHVRQQMDILAAAGTLGKKKAGARAVVYWHTDRTTGPRQDPAEHPDQAGLDDVGEIDDAPDAAAVEGDDDPVAEAMDRVNLPGRGDRLTARRNAFEELLTRIFERGETSDLYDPTYREFDTGYESVASWRTNAANPALKELQEDGIVECVDRSTGTWRWVGLDSE